MALKIQTSGGMKKIDTNLHKPVTFIGGNKYILDKAWVFVNGVKNIIWGQSGVQIDYISSTGSLGGGNLFAIGENWVNCYNNNTVYRIDISNLSNPTLVQNVAWGNVLRYNGFQSANDFVFESWNTATRTASKLSVDSNGGVSVLDSSAITATSSSTNTTTFVGATDNKIVCAFSEITSIQPTTVYKRSFYWSGVLKYAESNWVGGLGTLCQTTSSSVLIKKGTSAIYSATESGLTSLGVNVSFVDSIYDNGNVYCLSADSGNNVVNKYASNDLGNVLYSYSEGVGKKIKIIGAVSGNLYVLVVPTANISSASEVKFVILDMADLTSIHNEVLPNDPFNENNGVPTFWIDCKGMFQVSQTGFVGVSTYNANTLGLRIARFSTIF